MAMNHLRGPDLGPDRPLLRILAYAFGALAERGKLARGVLGFDMKHIAACLVAALPFASPSHAETPCDFKGISVGNTMTAAEIMTALGVTKYKTNPAPASFEKMMPIVEKYGTIAAMELEDWNIGPYCAETSCRIPYGVTVGADTPVSVFVSFRRGLITEIDVSFSEVNWDEVLPILDQKYGAGWKVDRRDTPITDYETKKIRMLELISLEHIINGTNRSTKDRCQISAANLDMVFEHHDAFGPYHSQVIIKLISKNF
jgi:hypothetical protein